MKYSWYWAFRTSIMCCEICVDFHWSQETHSVHESAPPSVRFLLAVWMEGKDLIMSNRV